eukprot:2843955-Amphidinium_carterae.1
MIAFNQSFDKIKAITRLIRACPDGQAAAGTKKHVESLKPNTQRVFKETTRTTSARMLWKRSVAHTHKHQLKRRGTRFHNAFCQSLKQRKAKISHQLKPDSSSICSAVQERLRHQRRTFWRLTHHVMRSDQQVSIIGTTANRGPPTDANMPACTVLMQVAHSTTSPHGNFFLN